MSATERKVKDLLSKLTLREKIGQLVQLNLGNIDLADDTVAETVLEEKVTYRSIGTICISPRDSYEESRRKIQAVQIYFREKTPHGIPALAVAETLHGVLTPGATIFPQATAMGSTWNPKLVKAIGEAIAQEASSILVNQALEPGQSRRVFFEISASELGLWNPAMEYVVEPGEFELMVGSSAEDIQLRETFEVIA